MPQKPGQKLHFTMWLSWSAATLGAPVMGWLAYVLLERTRTADNLGLAPFIYGLLVCAATMFFCGIGAVIAGAALRRTRPHTSRWRAFLELTVLLLPAGSAAMFAATCLLANTLLPPVLLLAMAAIYLFGPWRIRQVG